MPSRRQITLRAQNHPLMEQIRQQKPSIPAARHVTFPPSPTIPLGRAERNHRRATQDNGLKVLTTKKAIAYVQLILAGARYPGMRATDLLVTSEPFLVVRNTSGKKTKLTTGTAQAFCEILKATMNSLRKIREAFARKHRIDRNWLDLLTLLETTIDPYN